MEIMSNRLVVLFPGGKYSTDCPLLYYACFKYEVAGYDSKRLNCFNTENLDLTYEEYVNAVNENIKFQLNDVQFTNYDEVVFISKSIGTVAAGWIEEELHLKVKHIFLTPINDTFPYISKRKNIKCIISGTKDKKVNQEKLQEICQRENIPLYLIEGVGHRLESYGDMQVNLDILKRIVDLY